MRQYKIRFLLLAAMVSLGSLAVVAEDGGAATLTRVQWLKKIGAAVTDPAVLRETLAQVSPDERVEFTQRVLKAVKRLPVSPEEKAASFVSVAVACIANAPGEARYKVIAEVFADVPVEFLPVVTEELAKRFDQEYNGLSDADYQKIASAAVAAAVARNAQTDEPSVRNTFVLLAFLRGAKKRDDLQTVLTGLLPDERTRNLVATWLVPALNDHNYDGLLAAANVEGVSIPQESLLRLVGHSNMDRLLYDLYAGKGFQLLASGLDTVVKPTNISDIPVDHGINRLPRIPGTYQNQSNTIRSTR